MTKEIIKKLKYFIEIGKLTKELEFKATKTQKSQKLTKYSAHGASPSVYNKKN
jgi:hypothetical protein